MPKLGDRPLTTQDVKKSGFNQKFIIEEDYFKTPTKREIMQARFVASVNADSEANKMPTEYIRKNSEKRTVRDYKVIFQKYQSPDKKDLLSDKSKDHKK